MSVRYVATMDVALRVGTGAVQMVRALDISRHGFKVTRPADARVGGRITVTLPGAGDHDGWIVWTDERRCGIAFAQALRCDVLARLVQRRGPH